MNPNRRRQVVFVRDIEALAESAAARFLARVAQAEGRAAICLTGGTSPEGLYKRLAQDPYRGAVPWHRIHWFIGDERFVPADDILSNMGAARRLLLDKLGVPADSIHAIATDATSPEAAARLYEAELKRFYGRDRLDPANPLFDLVLMGLGRDGHTASLFPNSSALDEQLRWVVGVEQAGLAPFVPRITLTLPALASTHEMLFLVSGEDKREILIRVLSGEDLPASRARSDGDLVWLIDRAAGPEHFDARLPSDTSVIVVMGVSGSGKSTIASMLAHRLHWIYEDGDWFHPPSNIEKMHAGEPLTDQDRWPWLQAIAAWIDATRRVGNHGIIACSALKRAYRDVLVGERHDVRIVYLKGEQDLIARRLMVRDAHFMPPSLLDSQFATLEEPQEDENPIVVSIVPHPRQIVDAIVAALGKVETPQQRGMMPDAL